MLATSKTAVPTLSDGHPTGLYTDLNGNLRVAQAQTLSSTWKLHTVAVTNSAERLPTELWPSGFTAQALSTNAESIWVGPDTPSVGVGVEIPPGGSVYFRLNASESTFVMSASGGQTLTLFGTST